MGGEQAAGVLAQVKREQLGEAFSAEDEEKPKPRCANSTNVRPPYHASARLWDDGVIDPAQTRDVLALGLSAAMNAPAEPHALCVFRM